MRHSNCKLAINLQSKFEKHDKQQKHSIGAKSRENKNARKLQSKQSLALAIYGSLQKAKAKVWRRASRFEAPKMFVARSEVEARENETLSLTCPIKSTAADMQIEWSRDEAPIEASTAVQLSESNHKLHFLHIQRSQSGLYSCHIENEAGAATSVFDLRVLGERRVASRERRPKSRLQSRPSSTRHRSRRAASRCSAISR